MTNLCTEPESATTGLKLLGLPEKGFYKLIYVGMEWGAYKARMGPLTEWQMPWGLVMTHTYRLQMYLSMARTTQLSK